MRTAIGIIDLKRIPLNSMKFFLDHAGFRAPFSALAVALLLGGLAQAQQDSPNPAGQPTPIATEDVRAVADRLGQAVTQINVAKWKAPNEVKGQAQADIASIQRNLQTTLPGLLDQAKAAPVTVAPAFAVYRNLCAVYDVLLRVAGTATLAGPQQDGAALEDELVRLDSARKSLGAAIFDATSARDAEVTQLRASATQMAAQLAAVQAPAKKAVVNDGPPTTVKKKKKPSAAAAPPPSK